MRSAISYLSLEREAIDNTDGRMENLISILEPHFEMFTKGFIANLISTWSKEGTDSKKLIKSFKYLHCAINLDRRNFETFLEENFGSLTGEGIENSKKNLSSLSRHCNGDIEIEDDPIWRQCKSISDLPDEELKLQIGKYFKENCNKHLQEQYPQLYSTIKREFERTREEVNFLG